AARDSVDWPLSTSTSLTLPSAAITTRSVTSPSMPASRAIAGYTGASECMSRLCCSSGATGTALRQKPRHQRFVEPVDSGGGDAGEDAADVAGDNSTVSPPRPPAEPASLAPITPATPAAAPAYAGDSRPV